MIPVVLPQLSISMEEGKLRRVEESIRVFVRVADPKYRQVVPMRFFNLTLTAPEADAYSASFLEEKSLRADVARTLIRMVSISARINTELEELKRSQSMSSLWKLHADSVVVLLDISPSVTQVTDEIDSRGRKAKTRMDHLIEFLTDDNVKFVQKILENRPERTGKCPPPVLQGHDPRESHNTERQETSCCAFDGRRTHGWTVSGTNRRRRPGRLGKNNYRPGGRESLSREPAS